MKLILSVIFSLLVSANLFAQTPTPTAPAAESAATEAPAKELKSEHKKGAHKKAAKKAHAKKAHKAKAKHKKIKSITKIKRAANAALFLCHFENHFQNFMLSKTEIIISSKICVS